MNFIINDESIDKIALYYTNHKGEKDYNNLFTLREKFVKEFDNNRIISMKQEDYFLGHGKKQGCMSYELEWGTVNLGSIKGGSKYKYGYESDFVKIMNVIKKIVSLKSIKSYASNGTLTPELLEIVNLSKDINGFKTGRTVLPKLLSLYYPKIFMSIFNDQDFFLSKLVSNIIETEKVGLELYLEINFILLQFKLKLEERLLIKNLDNYIFSDMLYNAFPDRKQTQNNNVSNISNNQNEIQQFEALEVQHYQTLLHRNFRILFPYLKYFDEEEQAKRNGQYDTQTVGILDILAIDNNDNFVVIEIKRKASDQTIGQIMRYMGWVQEELCQHDQSVSGIIIAEKKDTYLDFALKKAPFIKFIRMDLNISLIEN